MKPSAFFNLSNINTFDALKKILSNTLSNYFQILDKKVGFNDNIDCFVARDIYFKPTTGTTIEHNLGKVPIGVIFIKTNNFNSTFAGNNWNEKTINIYSDYEMTATLLILGS